MKQLREHFEPIREGLEQGESYLLMYRSKPLGTLLPYAQTESSVQLLQQTSLSQPSFPPQNEIPTPPVSETKVSQPVEVVPQPPITPQAVSPTIPPLRRFGLKRLLTP